MWKLFIIDLVTWGNLFTKIQRNVWKSMICIVFHLLCTIWLLGLAQNFINVCIILLCILSVFFFIYFVIKDNNCYWEQSLKWKFELTGPNKILEFIFICNIVLQKTEKFTGPNKGFLGWRTCAHREDWRSKWVAFLIRCSFCFYLPIGWLDIRGHILVSLVPKLFQYARR